MLPSPTRCAICLSSASSSPERPATQQANGAAVRSDPCAAVAASSSSSVISSTEGGCTPAAHAKDAIHSSLLTASSIDPDRG